jgi:hypothetical protein
MGKEIDPLIPTKGIRETMVGNSSPGFFRQWNALCFFFPFPDFLFPFEITDFWRV